MTTLTEESQRIRTGKFTGSECHKLMGAKGFGKTGETYIMEKVAEYLTGEPAKQDFTSAATDWGNRYEPEAKEYFTAATGQQIDPAHTLSNDLICGTPDGLLLPDGGIEIKCPFNAGNHVQNLLLTDQAEVRSERTEYYWQMMAYMLLTGAKTWKFCSYHPSFKDEKKMLILNISRDEAELTLLTNRLTEAKKLFDDMLGRIK